MIFVANNNFIIVMVFLKKILLGSHKAIDVQIWDFGRPGANFTKATIVTIVTFVTLRS